MWCTFATTTTFCQHILCLCFTWLSRWTVIFCSESGVNWFVLLMGLQCGLCGSDILQSSDGLDSGLQHQSIVGSFCVCVCVCVALLSPLSCIHDFTVTNSSLKSQSVVIKLQQLHAAVHTLEVSRSNRSRTSAVHFFSIAKSFQLLVAVYRLRLIGNICGFPNMSFEDLRGRILLKTFVLNCSVPISGDVTSEWGNLSVTWKVAICVTQWILLTTLPFIFTVSSALHLVQAAGVP